MSSNGSLCPVPSVEGQYVLSPAKLRNVCAFIRTHLADDINLNMLANIARLSRYHFSRVFARTVGLSPYAYVVVCRIEIAMTLLRDPDLSLSDIATLTGFRSVAQLSAMFRRQTGVSSGKYRDVVRGEMGRPAGVVHSQQSASYDHAGA